MKKFWIFFLGGIMGFIAGAGAMLIAFPFLFPPPVVNESVSQQNIDSILVSTTFRETDGQDAGHWGKGDIKIYRDTNGDIMLELQSNFEVGAGPNFWLYLNTVADVDDEKDFQKDKGRIKITKLKSFSGSQVYRLPKEEYQTAKALTIWCETFHQYIASANLNEG